MYVAAHGVIARHTRALSVAGRGRVAIPGRETTAYRVPRLAAPQLQKIVAMRYDRILHAVSSGDVQARFIIHEIRFTYTEHQLQKAIDLGDW